jgi:hypothetical protein
MTLNECEILLYAGWLCDRRGWYKPGQTVTRGQLARGDPDTGCERKGR